MRLIDADELENMLRTDFDTLYETIFDTIRRVPTVDAVPVVRCRDCKNWDTTWQNDWARNYHYCPLVDGTRKGDWYCADGERKDDELQTD